MYIAGFIFYRGVGGDKERGETDVLVGGGGWKTKYIVYKLIWGRGGIEYLKEITKLNQTANVDLSDLKFANVY